MDFEKILMQEEINTIKSIYFALEVKIVLRQLTRISHILRVANNRVCPNDNFDLWAVYSG